MYRPQNQIQNPLEMDHAGYVRKLECGKNQTSWKRRCLTHNPIDLDVMERAKVILPLLSDCIGLKTLLGVDCTQEKAWEEEWGRKLFGAMYVDAALHSLLPRNTKTKRITTIDSALIECGPDKHAMFVELYGFSVEQARWLAPKAFPNGINLQHENRGVMGSEEITLMFVRRFRCADSETKISHAFGRDVSAVSAFLTAAVASFETRFRHLVSLDEMDKFQPFLASWNRAFRAKAQMNGQPLRGRFRPCNVAVDGHRITVAKPTTGNEAMVNPYCGNDPTLLFLVFVSPNGLVVGLSNGVPGGATDTSLALRLGVEQKLQQAGMIAMGDRLFGVSDQIRALPKSNQEHGFTQDELTCVSSLRICVEWWCVGESRGNY